MKRARAAIAALASLGLLAGCASQPMGPTVAVMPAASKPFEVFRDDEAICKDYARQEIGGQPEQANNRTVGSGLAGAAIGAGLGALVGRGPGAAFGAASGGLVGTGIGAGGPQGSGYGIQRRYDIAYAQCMYARGNQVPGYYHQALLPPPPR